jgi:hypothetical protein
MSIDNAAIRQPGAHDVIDGVTTRAPVDRSAHNILPFRPTGEILGVRQYKISPFGRNDKVFVRRSTR